MKNFFKLEACTTLCCFYLEATSPLLQCCVGKLDSQPHALLLFVGVVHSKVKRNKVWCRNILFTGLAVCVVLIQDTVLANMSLIRALQT